MIRLFLIILVLCLLLPLQAVQFPQYQGHINDFGRVMSPNTVRALNLLSLDIQKKTGFDLVVVTINNTGDITIEDYANRLYEKWGLGIKGKDEGALILMFPDKRRVRIETGYGAEGYLPDAVCNSIINNGMIPYFKQNNIEKGLITGYMAVARVLTKQFNTQFNIPQVREPQPRRYTQGRRKNSVFGSIFFFIILLLLMSTRFGRTMVFGMLLGSMLGGGRRYGGGGSFGGGFGGGGFSGFGGGMSGGGGASGSW